MLECTSCGEEVEDGIIENGHPYHYECDVEDKSKDLCYNLEEIGILLNVN